MVISLIPVPAFGIDLKGVTDVERERLKVTFDHGGVLFFRVERLNGGLPKLVLDREPEAGADRSTARTFRTELVRRFYDKYVHRSRYVRFKQAVRSFFDRNFQPTFVGWTEKDVENTLVIELETGGHYVASELCKDRYLQVLYYAFPSNPHQALVPLGVVSDIESITLTPKPLVNT